MTILSALDDRVREPWVVFDGGNSIGQTGSESGTILSDEEHPEGARITLEQDGYHPFSITCGVYGCLVHTRFFSTEREARTGLAEMKEPLVRIAVLQTLDQPDSSVRLATACQEFVKDFP